MNEAYLKVSTHISKVIMKSRLLIALFLVFLPIFLHVCYLQYHSKNSLSVDLTAEPVTAHITSTAITLPLSILTNSSEIKNQSSVPQGRKRKKSHNSGHKVNDTVTNEELQKLSELLFSRDVNNAWQYIHVNLQNQTTRNSSVDRAPEPLLTVDPQAFQIPTISHIIKMYDNYHLDTRKTEHMTPRQLKEQTNLIAAISQTDVMSTAMKFLSDKGFIPKNNVEHEEMLRKLWFSLYARAGGTSSSSGFEHVFLNELKKGKTIIGLHNWIYFNAVEVKREADYLGYFKYFSLGDKAAVLSFHFKFASFQKPITSIFIGTSPELEMALYTICFYAKRGKKCRVSLGGKKLNIITYPLNHQNETLPIIGAAYPLI